MFFIAISKILIRLNVVVVVVFGKFTAAECSNVFIFRETFASVNGEHSPRR